MDITLERIVQELKEQGKKQKDLTDFLGLAHNIFGNWKRGANSSYKKYIYAISDFLGVSVEYLRGETDQKKKPLVNSDEELTEAESLLLELFRGVPVESQQMMLEMIKIALKNQQ